MLVTLLLCAFFQSPSSDSYRIVSTRTDKEITLSQLAEEVAFRDIVYFGELHDNVAGHQVYAELFKLLTAKRTDTVLSMEMFERDTQGVVNDYLQGKMDEPTFLKHSRPWRDYSRDYRPLLEHARERKLDVIAGNLPRPVAAKVASKDGSNSPFLPRKTSAPMDRYRELFDDTMKGHPGIEGMMDRMYQAQCAKDDAMAESMANYLLSHPHRKPLMVHCNGNFHSDYGLGTAARFIERMPLSQHAIISMMATTEVTKADLSKEKGKGHYILVVPKPAPPPPPAVPEKTKDVPKK